jgi:two-component system response regulator RegA
MTTDAAHDLKTTLLIAEDDEALRLRLGRAFADRGYEVRLAASVSEALEAAVDAPELAVVDLRLPDGSGLDLVRALMEADPATRVVMLTGWGSIPTAMEAVRLGVVHYLTKPAGVAEILAALHRDVEEPFVAPEREDVPSLAIAEWEHIQRILASVNGNITQAARLLGLHRRSLQRKLAKNPGLRVG